jgi:predicted PurR-regulated permease PerM
LVWRAYYLIKKDNYLKISTLFICIFSVFAIILNIEGSNCITQINSLPLTNSSSNEERKMDTNNNLVNPGVEVQQQQQQQQNEGGQEQQQDPNTQSQQQLMQQSYELRKYCFLVTNLYVYSLFGIVIGFVILVFWYIRYKKIWSRRKNGPIN